MCPFEPGQQPPKAGETMAKPKSSAKPRHKYEFTIMNPSLVPMEYLRLDDEALAAHYDAEREKTAANPAYRTKGVPGIHVAEKIAEDNG